jgi:hypothetical protein
VETGNGLSSNGRIFLGFPVFPYGTRQVLLEVKFWVSSWKRIQVPVALQQFENENGGREFAPAPKPKSIEIDSLPPFVRDSTMKAVDDLGRRVTVGDVASRAGLKLTQAETALQALAADSGGFLEVLIN